MPAGQSPTDFEYESTQKVPSPITITTIDGDLIDVYGWRGTLQVRQFMGEEYKVPGSGYTFVNLIGTGSPRSKVTFWDAYENNNEATDAIRKYSGMIKKYISISNDLATYPAVLVHSCFYTYRKGTLELAIEKPPSSEFGSSSYESKVLRHALIIEMELEVQ